MKKIVLFAVVAFTCEVQAQNLFSPFRGLAFPRLNAAGIPNPQQPQPAPAPGPQTRGPVPAVAVWDWEYPRRSSAETPDRARG